MAGKTGQGAEKVKKDESEKRPKCVVQFRPHSTYDGEYGFDWLRMGDIGLKGDTWYAKIVGRYIGYFLGFKYNKQIYDGGTFEVKTDEYTKLTKEYGSKTISWKKALGHKDWFYSIPIMTLWKGDSIKLTLKIEIEEEPQELKFKPDDAFKITPEKIIEKTKGKRELSNFITIECLKEFLINKNIDVISVDSEKNEELVGRLTVMANSSQRQETKKILFVNIITLDTLGGEEKVSTTDVSNSQKLLKKYFKQFYTTPLFELIDIDLNQTRTKSDGTIERILDNDFANKFIKTDGNMKDTFDGVHDYLEKKLPNKELYKDHYKVYLISKTCPAETSYVINGQAQAIPSKQVVIFKTGINGDTITHELLHAMGLYHTFDNDGKFTFEKFKTENIMDYKETPATKRISTWKWQWKILNNKL